MLFIGIGFSDIGASRQYSPRVVCFLTQLHEGKAEVRSKGKVLATLSNGNFFGEMSLIDDAPRSADVVAVSPTKCWAITSWAFASVIKSNPEIAMGMLKEVVKRLRKAQSSPAS